MALDALIFDVDGTLVDTNGLHIEAWQRAFASMGYKVAADRIFVEVGKGGDTLVPSILGPEAAIGAAQLVVVISHRPRHPAAC